MDVVCHRATQSCGMLGLQVCWTHGETEARPGARLAQCPAAIEDRPCRGDSRSAGRSALLNDLQAPPLIAITARMDSTAPPIRNMSHQATGQRGQEQSS